MTLDVWIGVGLGLTYLLLVVWGLQEAIRRRRVLGTLAGQLSKLSTLLPFGPLEELSGAPSAMVVLQDEAEQKRHAGEEAEVAGTLPLAPSQGLVAGQVTLQVLGCRCPRCGLTWDVTILEREKVCYCGQAFQIPSVRGVERAIGQVHLGTSSGVLYRCPRCQTAGRSRDSFRVVDCSSCGQSYRCGADAS